MICSAIRVTPATFARALEKARAFFSRRGDCELTLNFSGGEYHLAEPVTLDAADFPGENRLRMIGGGRVKTVFSALDDLPASRFEAVPGKPYAVCQLDPLPDGSYPNIRAFYANGSIAPIARTQEYKVCPHFQEEGRVYRPHQGTWEKEYHHRLYIPLEAAEEAGIENCRGAELHIRVEWEFKIYHIDYIDTEDTYTAPDGRKYVAMQLRTDEGKTGNPVLHISERVFFICNTTSVLKTPGQYAYERATGRLYYYPEGPIADGVYGLSRITNLFTLNNFRALTLHGLTFTGIEDRILTETGYYAAAQAGRWIGVFRDIFPHAGAVRVDSCGEAHIENCVFTDLPCDGLSMVGVLDHVSITGNRFVNIGASAIRVGRPLPYSETELVHDLDISDNFCDNMGMTYENSCSIICTHAKDARLNHNTVLHSSYSAFSLGWKWDVADWSYGEKVNLENVEIAYNYIKSFVMHMRDGGGIYTLGGNAAPSLHTVEINTMHDNVVIEDALTCPENGFFGALYHDGASSNWHTYNNIVVHNPALDGSTGSYSARIYLQNVPDQLAWHILCENNYVCCCRNFGEIYRGQGVDEEHASNMLDAGRDLREIDTHMLRTVKQLKKIPEAVHILEASGCDPKVGKKR